MAIKCSHCSHLRRGQGGLKIGGIALPTVVAGCPCAEWRRVVYVDDELSEILIPGFVSETFASWLATWRFCGVEAGYTSFEILEFICTNYDLPGLTLTAAVNVRNADPETCTLAGGDALGGSSWNNFGGPNAYVPFFSAGGGTLYGFEMSGVAFLPDGFVDPPEFRLRYRMQPGT